MTFFQFTIALTNCYFGIFIVYMAFYSPTVIAAGVVAGCIFFFVCWAVQMHVTGESELVGMDPTAFYGQVGIFAALAIFLCVGIYTDAPEETAPYNTSNMALTWMIVGFCGFQCLNALPGIIIPVQFVGMYWPNKPVVGQIPQGQMAVYARGSMIGNFFLNMYIGVCMYTAPTIYYTAALFALYGFAGMGIMSHMILEAETYGVDIKMIIPWLIIIGTLTGAAGFTALTNM